MDEPTTLNYVIQSQSELNFSYMPFIAEGGLFILTSHSFSLYEIIYVNLQLPGQFEEQRVEGKVIWITPKNALYEMEEGIGIQFSGLMAKTIHDQILSSLDATLDTGGYTYGTISELAES